jgi:hypothetical protein
VGVSPRPCARTFRGLHFVSLWTPTILSYKILFNSNAFFSNPTRQEEKKQQPESELWHKKTSVPFMITMMMMVFQQWTGVNVVIFYTVTIFSAAKISIDAHLASNILGLVQLLATASKFSNSHAIIN